MLYIRNIYCRLNFLKKAVNKVSILHHFYVLKEADWSIHEGLGSVLSTIEAGGTWLASQHSEVKVGGSEAQRHPRLHMWLCGIEVSFGYVKIWRRRQRRREGRKERKKEWGGRGLREMSICMYMHVYVCIYIPQGIIRNGYSCTIHNFPKLRVPYIPIHCGMDKSAGA